jgi:cbb3-type cytochrome oxidase maturation protein
MSAILILLFVSIGIAGSFLLAFLWSVKDGQFDDDYSPARRVLWDDPARPEGKDQKEKTKPTLNSTSN